MITEKDLKEYKRLYKKEYGVDLSDKEVLDKTSRLVRLMRVVYLPDKKGIRF